MNRREALRAVSIIMGGTIVGANAFLTGCSPKKEELKDGSLFLDSDLSLLDEIGDTIIPTTDTPGAKAVGIGGFMAMMIKDCYDDKDTKLFTDGMKTFKEDFNNQYGVSFTGASENDRLQYLNALDKKLREKPTEEGLHQYFKMVKELTLLGYFSSEIGCTQAKRYIESPGRYDGCVDYKKGDRAWA